MSTRLPGRAAAIGSAALMVPSLGCGLATAASAQTAKAPKTYKSKPLEPRAHAVARGTRVAKSQLRGPRIFPTASEGFAIASIKQAQYPALTVNGGKTWKIDGPQLHVNAADAPASITAVGTAGRNLLYAYGPSVIDVSSNRGRSWRQTYFNQYVSSVVPGRKSALIAFVQQPAGGSQAKTQKYVSSDHQQRWTRTSRLAT